MKLNHKVVLTVVSIIGLTITPLFQSVAGAAFNKDRIIDDVLFSKKDAMSASQIDSFLNRFSHSCISTNSGFAAVKPAGYSPSTGFTYGSFVSAGNVIYTAAQAYDLNPQVLIVTLEKEQNLVTGRNNFAGYCNNGDEHKYAAAMGYGCPDNLTLHEYSGISLYRRNGIEHTSTNGDTCVNSRDKAGFTQQVIRAAWLLKFGQQRSLGNIDWAIVRGSWDNSDDPQSCYSGPMTRGNHQVCPSGSTVYYDGYRTIDGTKTFMGTGATAALYWYTPHFHGNELFVEFFERWFGSTQKSFESLDTPRWLQTKVDVYKKNPVTGQNVDSIIPAGTQIYFPTKISLNGTLYLRTQHDTDRSYSKGIPYSALEEISVIYEPMADPRWMELSYDTYKMIPREFKDVGPVLSKSRQIYFDQKVTIAGDTYLRTRHDSSNSIDKAIPLWRLQETPVAYEDFKEPRWMEFKVNSSMYDIKNTENTGAGYVTGQQIYLNKKITVNDRTYYRNNAPGNVNEYTGIPAAVLSEVNLDYTRLQNQRAMRTKTDIYKKDPVTGKNIDGVIPAGTEIFFPTKVTVGNLMYLRTQHDTERGHQKGILYSDLEEVNNTFVPLQQPRAMRTKTDIYKKDPVTGKNIDGVIPAGTEIFFPTKVTVGNLMYLRTQHDTERGHQKGILYSDLEEVN